MAGFEAFQSKKRRWHRFECRHFGRSAEHETLWETSVDIFLICAIELCFSLCCFALLGFYCVFVSLVLGLLYLLSFVFFALCLFLFRALAFEPMVV